MTEALIPSLSIENLCQQRDALIERIHKAHALMQEAQTLGSSALGEDIGYALSLWSNATRREFKPETMAKAIDARFWNHLLKQSGLQSFLDATARSEWQKAIDNNEVPELTLADIQATFSQLFQARGEMFERGVVEMFRKLSWDYRTNNPVRFGKRIVLRYGTESFCRPSFEGANKLDDLIRVMSILDGKPEPDHRHGAYHVLTAAGWPRNGPMELHGLLSVRGFRNGNAHITVLRPDLVEKMNLIIAKHYPRALGPAYTDLTAST